MQLLDDRILEHLSETGWSTAPLLAKEFDFELVTERRVRERLQELADAELIYFVCETSMVEISTWGDAYLAGEIDARNLNRMRPSRNYPMPQLRP
jgi:hypothetical protein